MDACPGFVRPRSRSTCNEYLVFLLLFSLVGFGVMSSPAVATCAQSRRHWLSARVYKRQLLLGYMVFNSALYGGQLVLYTLLFLPSFNQASKPHQLQAFAVLVPWSPSGICLLLWFWLFGVDTFHAVVVRIDGLFAVAPCRCCFNATLVLVGWWGASS